MHWLVIETLSKQAINLPTNPAVEAHVERLSQRGGHCTLRNGQLSTFLTSASESPIFKLIYCFNNDDNDFISIALFHVKHVQLR